jgi:hypothetical protein
MALNARSNRSDSRVVARIRKVDRPSADPGPSAEPARGRTRALTSASWRLLPWMRAFARCLLMRLRLGQWALVIRRVSADYRHFTGRTPSLLRPRRFTEKMQWRKLFELDATFAVQSDKLAARDFVAARIGPGRQADLLWAGNDPDAIPFDRLVAPYALKSTHASGHTIIVRDPSALDEASARATARGWLADCYGTSMNEPAYIHLPRRLIVERLLLRPDGTTPLEQKVYVFDGRAIFIRTNTPDANGRARFGDVHSRDWTRLPIAWDSPAHPVPPPRPVRLAEIIELAERLGAGTSHCRVDFYDCGDTVMVGELTLYSQSGLTVYADPADDFLLGAHWTISWPILRAVWAVAVRRWEIRPPRT